MNFGENINNLVKSYSGTAAIYIKNMETKKTFVLNKDEIFPSASIIKLLVMAEVLKKVSTGQITHDKKIAVSDRLITRGDGILKYLEVNHSFTIKELLTLMIIVSDNTAANILIDIAKMEDVNKLSINLGLKKTVLNRKMMDFKAAAKGKENITCADDKCAFLELLYDGKIINEACSKFIVDTMKKQQVHGKIDMFLPPSIILAHKTGTLEKLEHDVGILYGRKCDYIVCIFTKDGTSNEECNRFIGLVVKEFYYEYMNN
jgi:beta-lactamase class A